MKMKKPGSRGFTLIELLVVLGIISILAAVSLFAYRRYTRQAYASEVYAMIASIKNSEDAYKAETGSYLSTGNSEEDFYPVLGSAGSEPKRKPVDIETKLEWKNLGIAPTSSNLYCGYVAIAGNANDLGTAGPRGQTLFGAKTPTVAWYYIRATCDLDSDASKNSTYETTFDRQTVYIDNDGR